LVFSFTLRIWESSYLVTTQVIGSVCLVTCFAIRIRNWILVVNYSCWLIVFVYIYIFFKTNSNRIYWIPFPFLALPFFVRICVSPSQKSINVCFLFNFQLKRKNDKRNHLPLRPAYETSKNESFSFMTYWNYRSQLILIVLSKKPPCNFIKIKT
jgi:hypothetical protein